MGVDRLVDERQFILVHPNGTELPSGQRFWYSGASCCGVPVDDVGYLTELVNDAKSTFNIDDDRVYLWGHFNVGFMSYTMACERSEIVTAIASLAGSSFLDATDCAPRTDPVSVLQIHGDADATIECEGSPAFPGAVELFERHADFLGCDAGAAVAGPDLDLEAVLAGTDSNTPVDLPRVCVRCGGRAVDHRGW